MKKKEHKLKWRKLDNSAKIFPMSAGKNYSTVFRLSVLLKDDINNKILEKSVNLTLKKYSMFKVKMKSGFFWYYFEENTKNPIIKQEQEYPCKYINPKTNNDYLFKVTYYKNKINIDIFHSLTDGNSGNLFFKEIVYKYLELTYRDEFANEDRHIKKFSINTEDSYIKNYNKKAKAKSSLKKPYKLRGNKISLGAVSVIHQIFSITELKKICDEKNVTITQYLTAVLIHSIYFGNYKNSKNKRTIKVCIPVNLKKYFESNTVSNFFSYIIIDADYKKYNFEDFDQILICVRKNFEEKLQKQEIEKTMSSNVRLGINPFIRITPLILKNILVRAIYIEIRKYVTITFSNIGRMGIIGKYKNYIEYFMMLLSPEQVEKIKCSACTFEDKMVFSFTSILKDTSIEKEFYEFLINNGVNVEIESNGVLDDISKKN